MHTHKKINQGFWQLNLSKFNMKKFLLPFDQKYLLLQIYIGYTPSWLPTRHYVCYVVVVTSVHVLNYNNDDNRGKLFFLVLLLSFFWVNIDLIPHKKWYSSICCGFFVYELVFVISFIYMNI